MHRGANSSRRWAIRLTGIETSVSEVSLRANPDMSMGFTATAQMPLTLRVAQSAVSRPSDLCEKRRPSASPRPIQFPAISRPSSIFLVQKKSWIPPTRESTCEKRGMGGQHCSLTPPWTDSVTAAETISLGYSCRQLDLPSCRPRSPTTSYYSTLRFRLRSGGGKRDAVHQSRGPQ
jgi:hypothetical protein